MLVEELQPNIVCGVNNGTDFDQVILDRVEDQMGWEAETPIADGQFINRLTDEREIGKKPKRADQPRMVGLGLIFAELAFRKIVDVDEVRASAISKPVFSHDDARQLVAGRLRGRRLACPW